MDPAFHTAPELREVLKELRAREPIFHRPEFGNARADLERLMHESYWEVGASGTRYSREFVLQTLLARVSRRATWWRRAPTGWQILYHQGTLAAAQA